MGIQAGQAAAGGTPPNGGAGVPPPEAIMAEAWRTAQGLPASLAKVKAMTTLARAARESLNEKRLAELERRVVELTRRPDGDFADQR